MSINEKITPISLTLITVLIGLAKWQALASPLRTALVAASIILAGLAIASLFERLSPNLARQGRFRLLILSVGIIAFTLGSDQTYPFALPIGMITVATFTCLP
ncbi:hypothetical protein QYE77_15115 (plasmid) [Thermanaerothrix sp. 4228-RoL]|uniref:Uncharacterized protein n=1 Tax=Thermanaerothrix solaris TaxID=3058434 RepID=A0ABU3NRZ5_9CHLR|nr:hypothetical protein [Thermanaerothrix sp. 4228-RoL]MDT8899594.1 hypothetical protein [Thermanaerothrix sp. 4228-RoL]